MNSDSVRLRLQEIAHRVMIERGLEPDFPPAAILELDRLSAPASATPAARDMRALPWCSIDNDDSRDLDQLSVAEARPDGVTRIFVAVADVAALVTRGSALNAHAEANTTSVYTVAKIFPMLPGKLSTDLTSLNPDVDRLAIVIEMDVAPDGNVIRSDVYSAQVHNRAKLAYNGIARWLEGAAPPPAALAAVPGLEENLRLQARAARQLKALRHTRGALTFETIQARPVFVDGAFRDLEPEEKNTARELIEDFMIAANGVVARFLEHRRFPSVRRVVRTPKNWDRIVTLAEEYGARLPFHPDARALEEFLCAQRAKDPVRFPDLSLSVIKLLGAGEYVLELPGGASPGHFGLAVKDYAHSTAPNRRYPDLIAQRLLKAALAGAPVPFANEELAALAEHCTEQEDAAKKVERQVVKSAAAILLESRKGQQFDALVTGASEKGTWVRITRPPVEGKLVSGYGGRKVGERLHVQLVHTDVERGLIDFRAL